jgi:hypothetical protein
MPGDADGPKELDGSGEMGGPQPDGPAESGILYKETGQGQAPSWMAFTAAPDVDPDMAHFAPEGLEEGEEVPAWLASLWLAEEQSKQAAAAPASVPPTPEKKGDGAELSDSLRSVEPEQDGEEETPEATSADEIEALASLMAMQSALPLAKLITMPRTAASPDLPSVEPAAVESILALDCGSTVTRAILIDRVGGEYRFVGRCEAPSTGEPPWNDTMAGVRHSLSQLSEVMDRRFLDGAGHVISPEGDGGGVDAVVSIISAGQPPRLVLIGVGGDESLSRALRALSATCSTVERIVTLDGQNGGMRGDDVEGQVQLILESAPDAVVLVGGSDGDTSKPVLQAAGAIAMACSALPAPACPSIIFCGDAEMQSQVAEIVGADAAIRTVDSVFRENNSTQPHPLQVEIEALGRLTDPERLPGSLTLSDWSSGNVLPASRAFAQTIQYLAHLEGINVLGIEVGAATTTLASVIDEHADVAIRTELGMGPGLTQLLDRVPVEAVLRWLPFEIEPTDVRNILHNKVLRHRTLPQTRRELLLEQAAAREIISLALADGASRWPQGASRIHSDLLPRYHLIVGAGGVLANAPSCGQAALVLLDALQPVGISGLALDRVGLAAPLGAVATVSPLAAAQVIERDGLLSLGTVVAPVGTAREGDVALSLKIQHMDGWSYSVEVPYGSLEVLPLSMGQTADLELRPARQFDVGLGTKGQACRTKVAGGVIGVIVDARGRPVNIAPDPEDQRKRMEDWLWDIGA